MSGATLERAAARVERSLAKAVERGKLAAGDGAAARARLTVADAVGALADRQLVVEAVVEQKAAKIGVFGELAAIVEDPAAILASNTSSIPMTRRRSHAPAPSPSSTSARSRLSRPTAPASPSTPC